VLTRLGHGAVGGGNHEDRSVHLGGAGDHVLDVVGVARAVDVRVVTLVGLVFNVVDVDRDAALFFFGGVVNFVVVTRLRETLLRASTCVMAAVSVVLPWSTWPMVPMFTCGLLRSNLALAIADRPP
jgi:hypothetical protein